MIHLTLKQLFGENSSQDSQTLIIKKSDLTLLTPTMNNTATSLVVGILLKAIENFSGYIEDENGNLLTDENNNPITFDNSEAFEELKGFRWDDNLIGINNSIVVRNTLIIEVFSSYED